MPFWKKKEPEVPLPHVEPGMSASQSSEPNPIRFSDEPQFGTVHPSQTAVPPTRVRQPSDGEFATHPSAIQTPVTSSQKESFATVRPTPAPAQEMPLHIEENPLPRLLPQKNLRLKSNSIWKPLLMPPLMLSLSLPHRSPKSAVGLNVRLKKTSNSSKKRSCAVRNGFMHAEDLLVP